MTAELCLCDLEGSVEVVLATERHIEAPNWHGDGWLAVNAEGRLWRVDLAAPALEPIDTGFATRLNNDHGLSPDGRLFAISNHTEPGKSCIYTLPVEGGAPERVTAKVPSWWHGWIPSGGHVYAAARDGGPVLVHACAADGSDERCLAPGFDHADGPDVTPDGDWCWFNGERDGRVDLWRVRLDGSGLERMTHGATVDWFPHPSPDGAHVVWLAYPPGTTGHPGGRDVALCLMPQAGGAGREILRLHGGQGTINVPSWEPGGRRFAFVRYAP